MKIAIVDVLGLCYDGDTLKRRGLGGSESAVISMARELVKLGFVVHIYNDCKSDDCNPGMYDGVDYRPIQDNVTVEEQYDILIAQRSVAVFCNKSLHGQFKAFAGVIPTFLNVTKKILWMHDTFCDGDQYIEPMILQGFIDEIFTLSDFHTNYVLNCNHGNPRNFEVLKRKTFVTRNGINVYNKNVDVTKKIRNRFVYNSSVTKGMIPLVENIWPEVKKRIPEAELIVIGGFYRFRSDHGPDEQEKKFHELESKNKALGITFTGIIDQKQISEILETCGFMIYPAAFPETFGISALEALAYNVPIITCQFGALEETAVDLACYKIPYAIEPNSLFPAINKQQQIEAFVNTVEYAYRNEYLWQQKMYVCNQVKDVCEWSTVALQWKQHFYMIFAGNLPVEEYHKVSKINHRVHKVFGRRYTNLEELAHPKLSKEKRILVITPVFNAEKYIKQCIESVLSQDYDNYLMVVIDDCSTDKTFETISNIKKPIDKFRLVSNPYNEGAVHNQIVNINKFGQPGDIVILLDGDDWLVNDPTIFDRLNATYTDGAEFTYGSCWSIADNIPLVAQPYPEHVKQAKSYREHKFNWNMPYTHLRTFSFDLLNGIDEKVFKDMKGNWLKAGGDTAVFYNILEQANPENVICIPDILVNYNDLNPLNDYKVNAEEQTKTANQVIGKTMPKKKILIGIPTARYIESETFKCIFDLEVPDGYETTFQFFYGYNVDQVRNLIADWTVRGFDYLFSVDHDVTFPPDTLKRLLEHNKDMVSGIYRQRMEPQAIEIYRKEGGRHDIKDLKGLTEIGGCGFGCVLVKKEVLAAVGYPQFVYHSALDHSKTLSEDVDFCIKATKKGFKIWADPSILCGHIGAKTFTVDTGPVVSNAEAKQTILQKSKTERFKELRAMRLLPQDHIDYLKRIKEEWHLDGKINIYDIGSCVLHWTDEAEKIWPEAKFYLFEAMEGVEKMYQDGGWRYNLGVLSDEDGKVVDFWENEEHPGGNSYYQENPNLSPGATELFPSSKKVKTKTLDTVVYDRFFSLPDLIKMDVQGAELDIIKGALEIFRQTKHVILELQHVDYNLGAPKKDEIIRFMDELGFDCVTPEGFSKGSPLKVDDDYHFVNREI